MTFSVVWTAVATLAFARMEANAADPVVVRAAAAHVDRMLRRMARDLGESRAPGYRVWYEDVLGVFYHIDEDAMRVEVLFAGPARRH